jgi:hypothetical protein
MTAALAQHIGRDEAFEVVLAIDLRIAEEDFTLGLIRRLMKSLESDMTREEISDELGLSLANADALASERSGDLSAATCYGNFDVPAKEPNQHPTCEGNRRAGNSPDELGACDGPTNRDKQRHKASIPFHQRC